MDFRGEASVSGLKNTFAKSRERLDFFICFPSCLWVGWPAGPQKKTQRDIAYGRGPSFSWPKITKIMGNPEKDRAGLDNAKKLKKNGS
jgi:hypothetical protein